MKYRTRIDWWIALTLFAVGVVMPVIFLIGIPLDWYTDDETMVIIITSILSFVIVAVVTVISFVAAYYELGEKGLAVRNTFFHTRVVPYDKIISITESINIVNRPKTWAAPLSVVGVRVDYVNEDGQQSWFFIAPQNRQSFMQELTNRLNTPPQ